MKFYKTDWFLRISSLVIAIVLWYYVVYQENPMYSAWFSNVQIAQHNLSEDFDNGKLVILNISNEEVDIKVSGRRRLIAAVADRTPANVYIDMSNVTAAGRYELPINVNFGIDGVAIDQIKPDTCTVVVDKVVTAERNIDVVTKGAPADGYSADEVVISPSVVKLTGPQTIVDTVAECSITVDLTNAADDVKGLYKIKLYDSKGEEITDTSIIKNIEYTDVYCPVSVVKTVPVVASLSAMTNSEGKTVTAVCEPETISVKGKTDLLNNISQVYTGVINVSGITESTETEIEVILPDGIFAVDKNTIKVKLLVNK